MEHSISLEETNRLRISLGLKPIPTEQERPSDAWLDHKKNQDDQQRAAKVSESITAAKDRALHRTAIAGHSLEKTEKTLTWLQRLKSRARKVEEPEPEQEVQPEQIPEQEALPEQDHEVQPKPERDQETHSEPEIEAQSTVQPVQQEPKRTKPQEQEFDPLDYDPEYALEKAAAPSADFEAPKEKPKFKQRKKKGSKRQRIDTAEYSLANTNVPDEDDEDLQAVLQRSRAQAQQARAEANISLSYEHDSESEPESGGLVVSSTAQFLQSLKRKRELEPQKEIQEPRPDKPQTEAAAADDEAPAEVEVTTEVAAPTEAPDESQTEPQRHTESPLISQGLASTLKLLQSRVPLKTEDERKRKNREWTRRINAERLARQVELREQEEAYKNLPAKERRELRELQEKQAAAEDARDMAKQFDRYEPVVEIVHRDDDGNILSAKDAFKHLSHKFHGNAEGNKRAQRREKMRSEARKQIEKPLFD